MNKIYGISINKPDEVVFASGLFSCVEYAKSILNDENDFENLKSDAQKLCALSKKYDVKIRSFHLPFGEGFYPFTPSSLDGEKRAKTMEYTKKAINILKVCGIEIVVIHGSLKVLEEEREERLCVFCEYLKELCDFCAPLGISVAVETLKPRCLGRNLKEHLFIRENVNRDNLGICFDSNHLLQEDNLYFLENIGEHIITTHLSDFDGLDERHWFPGRGVNNWRKIISILQEKGYNEPYVFEVHFPGGEKTGEQLKTLINGWEALFE